MAILCCLAPGDFRSAQVHPGTAGPRDANEHGGDPPVRALESFAAQETDVTINSSSSTPPKGRASHPLVGRFWVISIHLHHVREVNEAL